MRAVLQSAGLVLALGSGPAAFAESEMFSDSGIDGPAYEQILRATADLPKQHAGWVTVMDYGRSVRGRVLRALRIQSPNAASATLGNPGGARQAVLISGATHGNEYLGFEDRLAPWFLENRQSSPGVMRFLASGGVIYVIPVVNPDGYEANQRDNSRGVDLNRDFDLIPTGEHKFRQVETRQLTEWLDQELVANSTQLRLTVDYHCCAGALLFPWSYADAALPADVQRGHLAVAKLMQQDIDRTYDFGNTSAVLGYYAKGTSKDYYYAKYGALAFTFEGAYREESFKFVQHQVWWDHVLTSLASADGGATATH